MNTGKGSVKHRECTLPKPDKLPDQRTSSSSTRKAIVAWVGSIVCCILPSSAWPSLWRRAHPGSSSPHSEQQQEKPSIEVYLPAAKCEASSQVSIAYLSVHDSWNVASPSFTSVKTAELPVESLKTPNLYELLLCEDSIRLLRIYKGTSSDPVEVTLELARLGDQGLEYEALSYVWGSSVTVSHIIHQKTQTPIPVTKNLYNALKGLRQAEKDRIIWADALCINQKDEKDKSTQVSKMNHIYARATRVVVWLGADEAGNADGAFGMLCALANTKVVSAQYATTSSQHVPFLPSAGFWASQNCVFYKKVMIFFCQKWFTRLWVLQEIALAQDAIFVWGDCSIPWRVVGLAIETIQEVGRIETCDMRNWFKTRNLHNAFFMWHLSTLNQRSQPQTYPESIPFIHLLDVARSFEATDPRDKIYALLGLPAKKDNFLVPDYTLSTCEVYTRTTRHLLNLGQNLLVLGFVLHTPPGTPETGPPTPNLPSWVPDFASKELPFPFSNLNTGHQYSAGFVRPFRLDLNTHQNTLRLAGAMMDTIEAVGPSTPFMHLHKWHPHFRALLQWCLKTGINATTITATLIAGRDMNGQLLSPQQKASWNLTLYTYISILELGVAFSPTRTEYTGLQETVWRFLTYRQPFITRTGKFGLGPWGLSEGDKIAVLWGGQCPFVIGEAADVRWMLKGECYIDDWMDGNVVAELVREAGTSDTEFEFV